MGLNQHNSPFRPADRPDTMGVLIRGGYMRRREFLGLVGAVGAAWPVGAAAQQQAGRIPRIGILMPFVEGDSEGHERNKAFQAGLQELGWLPDRNVKFEYRWVGADPERIRNAARELVELNPSVILAVTALTATPLKRLTATIPIVFINIGDPV